MILPICIPQTPGWNDHAHAGCARPSRTRTFFPICTQQIVNWNDHAYNRFQNTSPVCTFLPTRKIRRINWKEHAHPHTPHATVSSSLDLQNRKLGRSCRKSPDLASPETDFGPFCPVCDIACTNGAEWADRVRGCMVKASLVRGAKECAPREVREAPHETIQKKCMVPHIR